MAGGLAEQISVPSSFDRRIGLAAYSIASMIDEFEAFQSMMGGFISCESPKCLVGKEIEKLSFLVTARGYEVTTTVRSTPKLISQRNATATNGQA